MLDRPASPTSWVNHERVSGKFSSNSVVRLLATAEFRDPETSPIHQTPTRISSEIGSVRAPLGPGRYLGKAAAKWRRANQRRKPIQFGAGFHQVAGQTGLLPYRFHARLDRVAKSLQVGCRPTNLRNCKSNSTGQRLPHRALFLPRQAGNPAVNCWPYRRWDQT